MTLAELLFLLVASGVMDVGVGGGVRSSPGYSR